MHRWRAEPSTTTLNEALNALNEQDARNSRDRWQQGLGVLGDMAMQGLEPDVVTLGSLACAFARGVRWVEALRLLGGRGSGAVAAGAVSAALVGGIISGCTAALRWHWAVESLLHFRQADTACKKLGGKSDLSAGRLVICRGAVLKALARSSRWELCCAELREMWRRSRGAASATSGAPEPPPDLRAHNVAVSACELSGRWRQALLLLRLARRRRLQLDEISFSSAASACTRRGLAWAFGLWMWEELCLSGGPQPDVVFMTTTLTACEVGQRWHTAMRLHRNLLKQAGCLESDEVVNLAVISCCERSSFWRSALQLLGSMALTYGVGNAAVGACSRALQWAQSQLLLSSLLDPDVLSFAAFLEPAAFRHPIQSLACIISRIAFGCVFIGWYCRS